MSIDFENKESRLKYLDDKLDNLLSGINSSYGQALLDELVIRLQRTIKDFNDEVDSIMGSLKDNSDRKSKIIHDLMEGNKPIDENLKKMDSLKDDNRDFENITLNRHEDSLRHYRMQFKGRGKHIRTAQKDIKFNTSLIEKNTDSLASLIDDVSFQLDNFRRNTDKKFRDLTNDLDDLDSDIKGQIRKLKQGISDLEQTTSTLNKRIKEIEDLALIQKGKAEAAEEED